MVGITKIENEGAVIAINSDITDLVKDVGDSMCLEHTVPDEDLLGMDLVAVCCHALEVGALELLTQQGTKVGLVGLRGQTALGGSMLVEDASAFTLDKYMSDLRVTFDRSGSAAVPLFAYSHTGYFAVNFALANPDRVKALVLVEPALYTDAAELRKRAALARKGGGTDAMESMIRYAGGTPDFRADSRYAAQLREGWQNDVLMAYEWELRAAHPVTDSQLGSLRIPVLLVGGTESGAAFMVERAANAIPHATVWWMQGADHFSLMSPRHAEELASVTRTFLQSAGVMG